MIVYSKGGAAQFLNVFKISGSVFPRILPQTVLSAGLAGTCKYLLNQGYLDFLQDKIMLDNAMWTGFTFLVGFLVVFRTSQAYARFWEGCTCIFKMRAEWFDSCSALLAFCKMSKADAQEIKQFQNILVRLFSMLHASALAEIEDSNSKQFHEISAFKYELVDATGIDEESLFAIQHSESKVELIFQWIQQLIVENMWQADLKCGILNVPPPILSRAFQEAANGMVAFSDAIKVSSVPFPFPYAQTCDCLLLIHFVLTPLVVSQWFTSPWWAGTFTFVTVFILWVLNSIAVEIENPFGTDENDIDCRRMQLEFNSQLVQLLSHRQLRTPELSENVSKLGSEALKGRKSMMDAWKALRDGSLDDVDVIRSVRSSTGSSKPRRITARLGAWLGRASSRNTRSASIVESADSTVLTHEASGTSTDGKLGVVRFSTTDDDGSDDLVSVSVTSGSRHDREGEIQEDHIPPVLEGVPRISATSSTADGPASYDVAGMTPKDEEVADALECEESCAELHAFPLRLDRWISGAVASASSPSGGPEASVANHPAGSVGYPPCQGEMRLSRDGASSG